jgi:hypothetical protein
VSQPSHLHRKSSSVRCSVSRPNEVRVEIENYSPPSVDFRSNAANHNVPMSTNNSSSRIQRSSSSMSSRNKMLAKKTRRRNSTGTFIL